MASDRNPATKRKSNSSKALSNGDAALVAQSKKAKTLSTAKRSSSNNEHGNLSTSKRKFTSDDKLRPAPKRFAPERPSSTNIHNLTDELLVEILCRLPCAKSVCQCKLVSKSWLSPTLDPTIVQLFFWHQRQNKTLIPGAIINADGEELLPTELFARFRNFKTEGKRLQTLATWNDLVLCRSSYGNDGRYYICNPRTMQLATLPLLKEEEDHQFVELAVGFVCDPYYREEEEEVKIDAEYKWKVVRILPPDDCDNLCFEFKIQVFSSEIGEWRESLVPCPRGFIWRKLKSCIGGLGALAFNGMLYWKAEDGDLLGLGPLMKRTTAAYAESGYQFYVIRLDPQEHQHESLRPSEYYLQRHRGRLQLVQVVGNEDQRGARLLVWELKKEELEQMTVQGGGELGRRHRNAYDVISELHRIKYMEFEYMGSDPNDLAICFVYVHDHGYVDGHSTKIYKCNIHTRECKIYKEWDVSDGRTIERQAFEKKAFQLMLPWWPTPKPTYSKEIL